MTLRIDDEWAKFRNNNGEFRNWLHTWVYLDPLTCTQKFSFTPLPWILKEQPDGALLTSMYHLGITKRWPGEWKSWRPHRPLLSVATYGPLLSVATYGMMLPKFSDRCLSMKLESIRKKCSSDGEFIERLKKYVLYPN